MTDAAAPALATYGLEKRYGARRALNGLDLRVPRGVVYGFLGPNGAGKTTTMRLLVGLLRPDAGRIELLGEPFRGRDRKRLFRIGSLIETPAFYPYLSGRDNLRVIGAAGPRVDKSRIDEVLSFVGLTDRAKDRYDTYSLGMKQRLGIAAALLNNPELLLLDEPANGLDPAGIVAMRQLLRHVTSRGATVFLSSHILPEVQQLADIVGIIVDGKLVREGPLARMLEETGHVRVRVRDDEAQRAIEVLSRVAGPAQPPARDPSGGVTLSIQVPPARAADVNRLLAQAGVFVSRLEAGSDLEELFLEITTRPPTVGDPAAASSAPPSAPPPPQTTTPPA